MYPGKNNDMLCSNTFAEIERDAPEPFERGFSVDPDLLRDIAEIIHLHIFDAKDLVENLVEYVRKARKEGSFT
jgi:hypothetical protein